MINREELAEKRARIVDAREYEQVSKTVATLENLASQWRKVRADMLREYHDDYYLVGDIPEDLELALTYWRARKHMLSIFPES